MRNPLNFSIQSDMAGTAPNRFAALDKHNDTGSLLIFDASMVDYSRLLLSVSLVPSLLSVLVLLSSLPAVLFDVLSPGAVVSHCCLT